MNPLAPFFWIGSLFRTPTAGEKCRVEVDGESLRCFYPTGEVNMVAWTDLWLVGVETYGRGRLIGDVSIYLESPTSGFFVPLEAASTDELAKRLTQLPGFNGDAWRIAMSSIENARFVCWKKTRAKP